jgi:dCTP deaminase
MTEERKPDLEVSLEPDQASLFPELSVSAAGFRTGILASQHMAGLVGRRILPSKPLDDDQIQPSSLDLRLGTVAYEVQASFLPGERRTVLNRANELLIDKLDLTEGAVLRRGRVYVIPLLEELALTMDLSAKANPKSTTGRLDVFTRLIVDYGKEFESVPPGYRGPLYVEVVPRTFEVRVRTGTRLNQLRISRGTPSPSDTALTRLNAERQIVFSRAGVPVAPQIEEGLWLGVDLSAHDATKVVGYRAKHHTGVIDLAKVAHYDVSDFWDPILEPSTGFIVLDPKDFYILVSKQRIRIPADHAADMVPYDPSVGEFRVHYAGFFDPGFGCLDAAGTPAVLEVRSHEVPFVLEDGQPVARLVYERLLSPPTKLYGTGIGSSYQGQGLALSKHFKAAPSAQ